MNKIKLIEIGNMKQKLIEHIDQRDNQSRKYKKCQLVLT